MCTNLYRLVSPPDFHMSCGWHVVHVVRLWQTFVGSNRGVLYLCRRRTAANSPSLPLREPSLSIFSKVRPQPFGRYVRHDYGAPSLGHAIFGRHAHRCVGTTSMAYGGAVRWPPSGMSYHRCKGPRAAPTACQAAPKRGQAAHRYPRSAACPGSHRTVPPPHHRHPSLVPTLPPTARACGGSCCPAWSWQGLLPPASQR